MFEMHNEEKGVGNLILTGRKGQREGKSVSNLFEQQRKTDHKTWNTAEGNKRQKAVEGHDHVYH